MTKLPKASSVSSLDRPVYAVPPNGTRPHTSRSPLSRRQCHKVPEEMERSRQKRHSGLPIPPQRTGPAIAENHLQASTPGFRGELRLNCGLVAPGTQSENAELANSTVDAFQNGEISKAVMYSCLTNTVCAWERSEMELRSDKLVEQNKWLELAKVMMGD